MIELRHIIAEIMREMRILRAHCSFHKTSSLCLDRYEIADLCYHVMVLMIEAGISLEDIHRELASRHVIDKKVKQEKMV